jgi:hypothetical protein
MYREIKIGEKTIPMLANAATPLRYKQHFHKDILVELQNAQIESVKVTDSLPELAFIMANQAKAKEGKVDLNLLKETDYIDWLEQFDAFDIPMAADDIVSLYFGNALTEAEAKKKEGEQKEK